MEDFKASLNQITLAYDRGQAAVVVELCKKHLRKFPKDGFGWLYYGMVQTDLFRYAVAERALRRGITCCPKNVLLTGYTRLGNLFREKGNYKRATAWYRRAMKQKPQDATYHIFLADNAFKFGFLKQAEKHFRNALKCTEGNVDEAYFNLGGILLGRREYPEAIKCYREALKIDPKYQIARKRLEDAELALLMVNDTESSVG